MTYNLIHVIQHNESTFFQAEVSLCVMFSSDIYTVIRLDCQAFFYAVFHVVRIYQSSPTLSLCIVWGIQ